MRFRDLATGDRFEFDRGMLGSHLYGGPNGPWIKQGPRTYRHEDPEQVARMCWDKIKVGSINVKVRKLESAVVGNL